MREEARGWLGLIYDWRRRSTSHCEAGNLLAAQLLREEPAEERTQAQAYPQPRIALTAIFRHLGQLQALILHSKHSERARQSPSLRRLPGQPRHPTAEKPRASPLASRGWWRAWMEVRGLEVGLVVEGEEDREIGSWLEL
ncbi:uncharacterized protein LOC144578142 [Callithrix jacchus]